MMPASGVIMQLSDNLLDGIKPKHLCDFGIALMFRWWRAHNAKYIKSYAHAARSLLPSVLTPELQ